MSWRGVERYTWEQMENRCWDEFEEILKAQKVIEIRDTARQLRAFLSPESDGLRECWLETSLNGASQLSFELPLASAKWTAITSNCLIIAGGREYAILNDNAIDVVRDGEQLWGKVTAFESWKLLDKQYISITNEGSTPSWSQVTIVFGGTAAGGYPAGSAGSALTYLLAGSGWSLGTCDVTGVHDLETERESLLGNIQKVQELWGGFLVWDSLNKVLSLRSETLWQNYPGFQIRYAKNLKSITRTTDNDLVTRLYAFGKEDLDIGSVNGGVIYLDNHSYTGQIYEGMVENQDIDDPQTLKDWATDQLAKLCKPRNNYQVKTLDITCLPPWAHESYALGDMVDVIDEDCGGINDRCRLIRHKYDLFQPWNCEMELGDPIKTLAAIIASGAETANQVNSIFNGQGQLSGNRLFDESVITTKIAAAAVDASKLNTNTVIVAGDVWTDNNPAAGKVSWNGHKLYYAGVEYTIAGGNTDQKYIYFVKPAVYTPGNTVAYASSAGFPILNPGDHIIAVNNGGVHDPAWNNPAARQFIGSALIADAAILTANIADLAVTNAKINDLSVNKLTGGTIVAANAIYLGNTSFALNAANRNMVIKDAQSTPRNRVIVGQNGSQTTDYGIWVYDASGGLILGASGLGTNIVGTGQISDGAVTNNKITSVEANKITVNSAKIRAAQIEDLVVGSNVTMGSNASISWSNVTSKPFIPQTASDVGALPTNWIGATYIDSHGVYTGRIVANQINTSGLSAERIYKVGSPGNYAVIGGDYCDFKLYNSNGYNFFTVYDSVFGAGAFFDNSGSFLSFGNQHTRPQGDWNFSDCTNVTLPTSSVVAVFG